MRSRDLLLVAALATVSARAQAADPVSPTPNSLSSPLPLASSSPEAPNENQLIDTWLHRGTEVEAMRSRIGAARFDVVTAGLWSNPTFTFAGSVLLSGAPPDGKVNYGPQLSVPLPIFGQIAKRKDEANAALGVAEVEVVESLWDRSSDLQAAMLDRAFADAKIGELRQNLTELSRVDQIVQSRAAAGANSRYDVLRAGTTEATFRAALADSTMDRSRAEARIVSIIAAPGMTEAPITREGLAPFRGPENEQALVNFALGHRPDLELAERGIGAAEASAARYRREVVPIPTIGVGPYFTQGQQSVSLQASISLPLPVFDRNQGLVGRALAVADGQRSLAKALRQRIVTEVTSAFRARENARLALQDFETKGLQTTGELMKRAEVSYQAGTFSILDLLDAYRAVWEARSEQLELEQSFAEAEADLEHAAALLPAPVSETR